MFTRRDFIKGGVATFTVGFLAPALLTDMAEAAVTDKTLVVLYLGGGNDSISMVIPYNDPYYYSRRPNLSLPKDTVLQIGTDKSGVALGLHPRLTGLRSIFDAGKLAITQRTGYPNSSRSHFFGTDVWSTGDLTANTPFGWLGRYLSSLPAPVDPILAWNTTGSPVRALISPTVEVPSIRSLSGYAYQGTSQSAAETAAERAKAQAIASHVPVGRPHVAFVNSVAVSAFDTVDRIQSVNTYQPTVTYPNSGLGSALRMVAGTIVKQVGTKIFYVDTGGYDTHADQGTRGGTYFNLMATLNDAVTAFYRDLTNQGKMNDVLLVEFSEFGRQIDENSSLGSDHGSGSVMLLMGGAVKGGLYGSAPNLKPGPDNPTLEQNSIDVRYDIDFRAVYTQIAEGWLKAESASLLTGDFRDGRLTFL